MNDGKAANAQCGHFLPDAGKAIVHLPRQPRMEPFDFFSEPAFELVNAVRGQAPASADASMQA